MATRRRGPLALALLLGACGHSGHHAPAAPGPSRDWSAHPAIAIRPMPTDLWVLGDVHGDAERMGKLLAGAGVTDDDGRWQAGTAILVSVGDLVDKGDDSLGAVDALRGLQADAAAAGGEVIVLLGNHEAEFLADPGDDFADELEGAGRSPARVAAGAEEPGPWLRGLPFAARVGPWFVCHAGETRGRTLEALQAALQADVDAHGFAGAEVVGDDSLLEARLDPRPWWELSGQDPQAVLRARVTALGAEHLVIGHEPGKVELADGTERDAGELFQRWGLVFLVDTGMSRAVDYSKGELLHVHHGPHGDGAIAVERDGDLRHLWP